MCSFQTGTHLPRGPSAGWGADAGFCSPDAAGGQDSCDGETPAHLAPTAPTLLLLGPHHPLLQHCSGGTGSKNAATSRWSQRRGTRPPACPWTCPATAQSCAAPAALPAAACRHAGSGSGGALQGPGAARGSAPLRPGASQHCLPRRLVQMAGPALSGTDGLQALHLNVSRGLAHDLLLSFSPAQVRGDRCHLGSHTAGWALAHFFHPTLAVASWTCSSSSIPCRAGPGLAGCTVEEPCLFGHHSPGSWPSSGQVVQRKMSDRMPPACLKPLTWPRHARGPRPTG